MLSLWAGLLMEHIIIGIIITMGIAWACVGVYGLTSVVCGIAVDDKRQRLAESALRAALAEPDPFAHPIQHFSNAIGQDAFDRSFSEEDLPDNVIPFDRGEQ